jgi:hypothetical protein
MILSLLTCSLNQITVGENCELIGFTMQQPLRELEGVR